MYSNCFCRCSFRTEIIKIGQSSRKMYSNNILNFQESMTNLNARTKKSGNLLNSPRTSFPFILSAGAVEYTDCTSAEQYDPLPIECPVYDDKHSDGEVPAMLEVWGIWSTPSLPSLPGPL